MKNLDFKKILPYVYGALLVVCGILIVAIPQFWIKFFVVIFGLCSIAYGIYEFIQIKDISEDAKKYKTSVLIKAAVSIVFGIFSVVVPLSVATAAWKIVVYFFAAGLIAVSALGFYSVSQLHENSPKRKQYILENLALLAVAIVLFLISPEKLGTTIIRVVGICALVAGLIWIAITVISGNTSSKDIVVEAETADVVDTTPAAEETAEETPLIEETPAKAKRSRKKKSE